MHPVGVQFESQPSALVRLLSSQYSPGTRRPLPHARNLQIESQLLPAVVPAAGEHSPPLQSASVVQEEPLGLDEVMDILDEASQVRAYSRELERKSRELEAATGELRAANAQLQELDRMKDDFVSTVTHELRTPLTSIRSFSEILLDNPALDQGQRRARLGLPVPPRALP